MARKPKKSAQSTASKSLSSATLTSHSKRCQQQSLPPVLRQQPTIAAQRSTNSYQPARQATDKQDIHSRQARHWNDSTLSRLSSQIRVLSRQSTLVPEYQPFKTLNTKNILLAPISTPSTVKSSHQNSATLSACSRSIDASYSGLVRPSRTLDMVSDYERHMERMNKLASKTARVPFAEMHYEMQYWRNKERGGPINRKYSAGKHQNLMDRYRIRQKTMLSGVGSSGDIPLQSIQMAFDYQQYAKSALRNSWRSGPLKLFNRSSFVCIRLFVYTTLLKTCTCIYKSEIPRSCIIL